MRVVKWNPVESETVKVRQFKGSRERTATQGKRFQLNVKCVSIDLGHQVYVCR